MISSDDPTERMVFVLGLAATATPTTLGGGGGGAGDQIVTPLIFRSMIPNEIEMETHLHRLLDRLSDNDKDSPPPASRASIEAMPDVKVTEEELGVGLECSICLGGYEAGSEAREMPCQHRYHSGCIVKWLGIRGSCPVCRYEMPVEEDGNGNEKGGDGGGEFEEDVAARISFYHVSGGGDGDGDVPPSGDGAAADEGSLTENMEIDDC